LILFKLGALKENSAWLEIHSFAGITALPLVIHLKITVNWFNCWLSGVVGMPAAIPHTQYHPKPV